MTTVEYPYKAFFFFGGACLIKLVKFWEMGWCCQNDIKISKKILLLSCRYKKVTIQIPFQSNKPLLPSLQTSIRKSHGFYFPLKKDWDDNIVVWFREMKLCNKKNK